ncbi:unnamed protein product [Toxocara canis]|uniref:Ubiquitin carboxyl-terminal hydrolase 7 n=1 Tax=Toxocara canis TaxID=6265 RepID=A0A183VB89_TOXCA|nr:unnamed protein product [Toxocara canis]
MATAVLVSSIFTLQRSCVESDSVDQNIGHEEHMDASEQNDHLRVVMDEDPYREQVTLRLDIDRFSEFAVGHPNTGRRLSQPIYARGLPWRILAIPRQRMMSTEAGQRVLVSDFGFFIQCSDEIDVKSEAEPWSCAATAVLIVLAQQPGIKNCTKHIHHVFHQRESDWGFWHFMTCDFLLNPENGFIKDDIVKLEVTLSADAPHGIKWDSKKHSGFIGLKNQGATCYLNSILQTFFFTNMLRKAVYQMPTENDDPERSVALAMQRVFYELQTSDKPVGTRKLTRSFGWENIELFHQHDVQELCRVLLDNLESKMKHTSVKGAIPWLFEGKMKSYVRCKEVPFESVREESFYDLQLNISGKTNGICVPRLPGRAYHLSV